MTLTDFSRAHARPLSRPGCIGISIAPIQNEPTFSATALYFSPRAQSDQHSAAYPQTIAVTRGRGWVSVGAERRTVESGQSVFLPPDVLHQFGTEDETMDALTFAWEVKHGRSLVVAPDANALARRGAEWFVAYARDAIRARGKFSVALSGGSTPRAMYALLASDEFRAQVDWTRVYFFWSDERAVPSDSVDSCYRLANDLLLAKIPAQKENVFRIETERGAQDAARAYEKSLRGFFGAGERFDLVLLGLGTNGHTASLFPHTHVLNEKEKWVAAEYIDEVKMERITFTAPFINRAAQVMFLIGGADKADVVWQVWHHERPIEEHPANLIEPLNGDALWLVDDAAAGRFAKLYMKP